jgi:sensor histidine kinase regulating citrate/malate metabolism
VIKRLIGRGTVASRLFAVQSVFVLVLSGVVLVGLWLDANQRVDQQARAHTQSVAASIADDPFVVAAVQKPDPSEPLEPYAVRRMRDSAVDFVTIMSTAGIRYTHPDPTEIGKPYIGTIGPARRGHPLTETYTGTLGPSVRSVYPVFGTDRKVVALVSAGVTVGSVAVAVNAQLPFVVGAALVLLLLGGLEALLLHRYLNRVTHSMGPEELERMFSYYEAVLYSVREGLLLVDAGGTVTLYNQRAAQLLNLPMPDANDRRARMPVADMPVPEPMRALLSGGDRVHDLVQLTDDRVLVINQEPARAPGRSRLPARLGTVTTIRDHTELQQLTGELQTMRTLADSLRSQTHEFSNKLHTMVSLIELNRTDEALEFATEELQVNQLLADQLVGAIDEPVLAALVLGKTSQAQERGVRLKVSVASTGMRPNVNPADLVTIVGNLLDNAIDSAADSAEPWVALELAMEREQHGASAFVITVSDSGPGVAREHEGAIFERGYSTKQPGHNRGYGLALVAQAVRRSEGSIRHRKGPVGAVFVVALPVADTRSTSESTVMPGDAAASPAGAAAGGEVGTRPGGDDIR